MKHEEAVKKVLNVARYEIGYHETGENQTKYASQYDYDTKLYGFDMSGLPWCDYFVDWCFCRAFGYDVGSAVIYQFSGCSGASCEASASYYKAHNSFYLTPEQGDQIFFYSGGGINHTGIVEEISNGYVSTIEGNSSDRVQRNTYRIADPSIAGYGRPAWVYAEEHTAYQDNKSEEREDPETERDEYDEQDYYYDLLDVDGEFGKLTEQQLSSFQKTQGIEADGRAGPETWGKIAEILGKQILKNGSTGWAVSALQAAINAVNVYENK